MITKSGLARMFESARKMSLHRLTVSGPLLMQGDDEMCGRFPPVNLLAGS